MISSSWRSLLLLNRKHDFQPVSLRSKETRIGEQRQGPAASFCSIKYLTGGSGVGVGTGSKTEFENDKRLETLTHTHMKK